MSWQIYRRFTITFGRFRKMLFKKTSGRQASASLPRNYTYKTLVFKERKEGKQTNGRQNYMKVSNLCHKLFVQVMMVPQGPLPNWSWSAENSINFSTKTTPKIQWPPEKNSITKQKPCIDHPWEWNCDSPASKVNVLSIRLQLLDTTGYFTTLLDSQT